jgi:hypothetical protein
MKRKEFIRNISLVGVGISLAPTQLFGSTNQTFQLPEAAIHVPHGNFAETKPELILIKEMGIEVSVQHFMRNGIGRSQKDISVFTFYRKKEVLNVCFDAEGCHTSGEIGGFKLNKSNKQFSISNNHFQLDLKAGSSYLSLRKV